MHNVYRLVVPVTIKKFRPSRTTEVGEPFLIKGGDMFFLNPYFRNPNRSDGVYSIDSEDYYEKCDEAECASCKYRFICFTER